MRDVEHGNPTREFSLHLTLLSSDIIKSGAREASKISISCDISEVPKVNCTIIFSRQNQDLGPIGSIKFSKTRPIASAFVNLSEDSFDELKDLLCLSVSPRPASFFLSTSKYLEGNNGEAKMRNSGLSLEIYDLSWRYPIL
ncbi:hypothetical protein OAZ89_00710 [Paracoccaceae bacterium]|jgi:hypothetical protein|nr:hypothetical protein [Paracoccaceae bacterium]MDC3021015.1 hypothetical protein [Paracoccaceae bacterium]|tara:strand:- start:50 stop:472 length:423 start_codon:yes stop_codon:yes gene_type:complete